MPPLRGDSQMEMENAPLCVKTYLLGCDQQR